MPPHNSTFFVESVQEASTIIEAWLNHLLLENPCSVADYAKHVCVPESHKTG